MSIDPPRAGRLAGPKKLAFDLRAGERKSVTVNVTLAEGAPHVFVRAEARPTGGATMASTPPRRLGGATFITPAAMLLTLEHQPTWLIPRIDALAAPEQVAAAVGNLPPLELKWAHHVAARFRCALAGDDLALLAEVEDVRFQQARPPWEGSCIEVFGSRPDAKENGQVILAPQTPSQAVQAWVFRGGCCPEDRVRLHTVATEGGYVLSALIPEDLLKFAPEKRGQSLVRAEPTAGTSPHEPSDSPVENENKPQTAGTDAGRREGLDETAVASSSPTHLCPLDGDSPQQLLLEFSLTTALAAAQGEFIRVQAFDAPCPSPSTTGYALVSVNAK